MPSLRLRRPNNTNKIFEISWVISTRRNKVATLPKAADNAVITANADIAPKNTRTRLYCAAMMAAMKNVLSPISETRMTDIEATKA